MVSLICKFGISPRFLRSQALHPTLATAVFWILDIRPGMEQGRAVKPPVRIARMGDVVAADDLDQPLIFMDLHRSSVTSASLARLPFHGPLSQQCGDVLV